VALGLLTIADKVFAEVWRILQPGFVSHFFMTWDFRQLRRSP
jgi:hypothetical protein